MYGKLKVFLSSSQFQGEFKTERELLPIIFDTDLLSSMFWLWKIEDQAMPTSPEETYLANVASSNIFMILVDSLVRDPVKREWQKAKECRIPIFCFIKTNDTRPAEAVNFIEDIRKNGATTTDYLSPRELADKVKDSLIGYFLSLTERKESLEEGKHGMLEPDERSLRIITGILNNKQSKVTKELFLKRLMIDELCDTLLTKDQLISTLRSKRYCSIQDDTVFEKLFEQLIEEKELLATEDGRYKLRELTIDSVNEEQRNIVEKELSLFKRLYAEYGDQSAQNETQFIKTAKNCLCQVIYWSALADSEVGKECDYNTNAYDADELKRLISRAILQVTGKETEVAVWFQIILNIIKSDEPILVKWLNQVFRAYWVMCVLGSDPDIAAVYKENLSRYCIYLDSHIIIRAMVESGSEHDSCVNIVKAGRRHSIDMRAAEPIYIEVEKAFTTADRIYDSTGGDIKRIMEFYEKLDRKNDIFTGYLAAKAKLPDLEWSSYITRFYSSCDQSVLKNYLNKEMGILVDRDNRNDKDWITIQSIMEKLLNKRKKQARCVGETNEIDELERKVILRTNEAKQIDLIFSLRKDNQKEYWFITYDTFIYKVCNDIYESERRSAQYFPCYMKPNRWLEILSNTVQNGLDINTFREVLLSPTIQHVADKVESSVISELLKARIDKQIKDKQTLKHMLREAVHRVAVEDIKRELYGTPEKQDDFEAALAKLVREYLGGRMKGLELKIEEQDKEIVQAKRKAEKEKKRAHYYKAQLTRIVKGKRQV